MSTVDDTVFESKSGFFDLHFFSFATGESSMQESLASISTIFNENVKYTGIRENKIWDNNLILFWLVKQSGTMNSIQVFPTFIVKIF